MGRKHKIHERIVIKKEDLPKERKPFAKKTKIHNPARSFRYDNEDAEILEGLAEWEEEKRKKDS